MPKMDWKVNIDNQTYAITLEHNPLLGSRKIWVNGELFERCAPTVSYNGSIHPLKLGLHSGHILISKAQFHYYYQLYIDGRPAEYEDDWWFSGTQKQAAFYQLEQFEWETVGKNTGLTYLPDLNYFPEGTYTYRYFFPIHRLVGKFQGFFTKIAPAAYLNGYAITLTVLFRHAKIEDSSSLQKTLLEDPKVRGWLSRFQKKEDAIVVNRDATYLYLPVNSKDNFSETLCEQVSYLAKVIGKYARSLPEECEGVGIDHSDLSTYKWVLINGFPFHECPTCISQVPELAKKNQEAAKLISPGLHKSILYQLIALVVGLVLLILFIPANELMLLLAICLFVAATPTIVEKTCRIITKEGMLIAFGFTTLYNSLVLLFLLLHQVLSRTGINFSIDLLWLILSQLSRNIGIVLLFSAIPAFIVPLILDYKRLKQEESLRPYLHPTVEILPNRIIDTK